MRLLSTFSAFLALFTYRVIAFPAYGSLAGLTREQLDAIIPTLEIREPATPPGPLKDTSAKLVNDKAHPWKPLKPGDIRGPCPGLNTLASHGVSNYTTTLCPMLIARFVVAPEERYCQSS